MSNLICPFCQQEYIITKDDSCFGQQRCVCRNPNCEFDGWHFPVKLVSKLTRTRKALELAITGLKNCKTRDHIGAVCRTPEYVDNVLEQITALEQKD